MIFTVPEYGTSGSVSTPVTDLYATTIHLGAGQEVDLTAPSTGILRVEDASNTSSAVVQLVSDTGANVVQLINDGVDLVLQADVTGSVFLSPNGDPKGATSWEADASGHFLPVSDDAQNLGSATRQVQSLYLGTSLVAASGATISSSGTLGVDATTLNLGGSATTVSVGHSGATTLNLDAVTANLGPNATTINVGHAGASIDFPAGSMVDFTGATVTGLPVGGSTPDLQAVLGAGNTSGVHDIVLSSGTSLYFTTDTRIRDGSGGSVILEDPTNVAHGTLYMYDSTGLQYGGIRQTTTALRLISLGGVRVDLTATALQPALAGNTDLGDAAVPWGSLFLGNATAQAEISTDALSDGIVTISDPASSVGGQLRLLDAAGNPDVKLYEATGYAYLDGQSGTRLLVGGTLAFTILGSSIRPSPTNTNLLGVDADTFAGLYLGDSGYIQWSPSGTPDLRLSRTGAGILSLQAQGANTPSVRVYDQANTEYLNLINNSIVSWLSGAGVETLTIQVNNTGAGTSRLVLNAEEVTLDATSAGFSLDAVTASNVTVSGATADLTLGARGATVTLNESGDTALSGFTATSLVGALNELKSGGGGASYTQTFTNNTGSALLEGEIVAPHTTAGEVVLADASADNNLSLVVGFVGSGGIANTASGDVYTLLGQKVTARFDGSLTLAVGDRVYLSETAGRITNVAPSSANTVAQLVGWITSTLSYNGTSNLLAQIFFTAGPRLVN